MQDEEGDIDIWLAQSVTALVAIDELDRAQELVQDMLAAASRRGSVLGASAASSFQGWVHAQRGDLARAEATAPHLVGVLHSGRQNFSVRSVDGAGNVDPTPAVYAWTSDLTAPGGPRWRSSLRPARRR